MVEHVIECDDLRKLAAVQYAGVTKNEEAVIRDAAKRADALIAVRQAQDAEANAQAEVIRHDNERIMMYLATVTVRQGFAEHRSPQGTIPQLPREGVARQYSNDEGFLPPGGHYIEWYARTIDGLVSPEKRFFTRRYDQNRLWYTEGGTHNDAAVWWVQDRRDGDWIRFRGNEGH